MDTYIDADHPHKAEDRPCVSDVAICCGGTLMSWVLTTEGCGTPSTSEGRMADGVKGHLSRGGILEFLMPSSAVGQLTSKLSAVASLIQWEEVPLGYTFHLGHH